MSHELFTTVIGIIYTFNILVVLAYLRHESPRSFWKLLLLALVGFPLLGIEILIDKDQRYMTEDTMTTALGYIAISCFFYMAGLAILLF